MGDGWVSLGSLWWHPWRGAREAVACKEIVWWELGVVFLLEILAMSVATLFSVGGNFSSFFRSLAMVSFFSLGTVLYWIIVMGGMVFLLTSVFRRVVVPERLFFLVGVSHLPWVGIFPFFLLSLWMPQLSLFLMAISSLFSFFWLWETLCLEYALSRGKALVVMVLPFVVFVVGEVWSLLRMVIIVGLQGGV
ncbi:MAG: hypothetical protein ACK4HQ_05355 [Brevinematales bacterium]